MVVITVKNAHMLSSRTPIQRFIAAKPKVAFAHFSIVLLKSYLKNFVLLCTLTETRPFISNEKVVWIGALLIPSSF
jgi:hypothetical protein